MREKVGWALPTRKSKKSEIRDQKSEKNEMGKNPCDLALSIRVIRRNQRSDEKKSRVGTAHQKK
jgi:hypothetical protein